MTPCISSLRSVQTERKAVKVLGTMFMLFFISWASFFSMNLAMGLCPTCHFEELLYKWFLWLGYSSSILNPIIYTVFNRAFKQTFLRLLTCGLKRIPSPGRKCETETEMKTTDVEANAFEIKCMTKTGTKTAVLV